MISVQLCNTFKTSITATYISTDKCTTTTYYTNNSVITAFKSFPPVTKANFNDYASTSNTTSVITSVLLLLQALI